MQEDVIYLKEEDLVAEDVNVEYYIICDIIIIITHSMQEFMLNCSNYTTA